MIPYLGKGYEHTGNFLEIKGIPGYNQMDGLIVPMEDYTFLERCELFYASYNCRISVRLSCFQKYIVFYVYHKSIHLAVIRSSPIFPVISTLFPNTEPYVIQLKNVG